MLTLMSNVDKKFPWKKFFFCIEKRNKSCSNDATLCAGSEIFVRTKEVRKFPVGYISNYLSINIIDITQSWQIIHYKML